MKNMQKFVTGTSRGAQPEELQPIAQASTPQNNGSSVSLRSRLRVRALRTAAVISLAGSGLLVGVFAAPASANAGNCRAGLNTATTAWGHCDYVGGPTYTSGFRLVVNCYYYSQQISYGVAGQSIYASCPSWSHVTWEQAQPFYG